MAEGKDMHIHVHVDCDGIDDGEPVETVVLPADYLTRFGELLTKVETVLNMTNENSTNIGRLAQKIERLETVMATVDESVARVNSALENVGADITRLQQEAADAAAAHGAAMARLQDQITDILANQDATVAARVQEAVAAFQAETEGKVQGVADSAEALAGRIPEPVEPQPEPEPEPTPEPTPGEPGNPESPPPGTFIP